VYALARSVLFALEAERAHDVASWVGRLAQLVPHDLVRGFDPVGGPAQRQRVWGIDFPHPVGLAAGCDKNARLLRFWALVGFGAIEVGSVSARPAVGNPRPRAFRLPRDQALVNRMGLNNDGALVIARRLARLSRGPVPIGANLVKTHDPAIAGSGALDDFEASFRAVAPVARWITLNVSCPNTVEGKTFEEPAALDLLLGRIGVAARDLRRAPPVLVKLSPCGPAGPDLGLLAETVAIARAHGVAGFVAANTAADREGLVSDAAELARVGRGGLSGPPLAVRSEILVRALFRATGGAVPIIGVGGIDSGLAAYRRIRAGATLVQLYTALVYHGPGVVHRVRAELGALLARDGFARVADAVGADAD